MQIKLGEKIKELRKMSGRKQEDLASALGVTSQAISRWEASGGYPDMEMIPAIANYFGITIDELFGYESDRTRKVDRYYRQIIDMNHKNNGVDTCMDECIALSLIHILTKLKEYTKRLLLHWRQTKQKKYYRHFTQAMPL